MTPSSLDETTAQLRTVVENYAQAERKRWTEQNNQAARRMRQAPDVDTWGQVLAEAAQVSAAAVFRLNGSDLRLVGLHGEKSPEIEQSLRTKGIPREAAPALANALDTQDTVIALRSSGELSSQLIELFPQATATKVYLFVLSARRKPTGLLYVAPAEGQTPDVNALELLCTLAEASWQETPAAHPPAVPLLAIAPATPAKRGWDALSKTEQDIHLRAQNFARTQVARLLLQNHDAVRTAREMGNLYQSFQPAIDADRLSFRERFLTGQPSMVDYLHVELVRTLTEGNAPLLGPDYPGPLA